MSTQNEVQILELDRIRSETKILIKQTKRNFEYIAETSKSNPEEFFGYRMSIIKSHSFVVSDRLKIMMVTTRIVKMKWLQS